MQIAYVLYDGMTALDVIGPAEVLTRLPDVDTILTAVQAGPVSTDAGAVDLVARQSLAQVPAPDVVVVPGGLTGTRQAMREPELLKWLIQVGDHATWMTSVCTGALVLGAAGLLEGRRATTHWALVDELGDHGATPLRERFVVDGRLVSAAGVSAGIDMALWLAGQLGGDDVAKLIQLAIEYDPAPPYASGSPTTAGSAMTDLARSLIIGAFDRPVPRAAPHRSSP